MVPRRLGCRLQRVWCPVRWGDPRGNNVRICETWDTKWTDQLTLGEIMLINRQLVIRSRHREALYGSNGGLQTPVKFTSPLPDSFRRGWKSLSLKSLHRL